MANQNIAYFLDGRIDIIKNTHRAWIEDFLSGTYDLPLFLRRIKIGKTHVKNQIPPLFLSSGFSILRILLFDQLENAAEGKPPDTCPRCARALGRLLDPCHFLIDRSYEQDRLNRVSQVTGYVITIDRGSGDAETQTKCMATKTS